MCIASHIQYGQINVPSKLILFIHIIIIIPDVTNRSFFLTETTQSVHTSIFFSMNTESSHLVEL
jgi:hypothetical protein